LSTQQYNLGVNVGLGVFRSNRSEEKNKSKKKFCLKVSKKLLL